MATKKNSKLRSFLEANFVEFSQLNSERLTALYSDFSKLFLLNKYAYDTNVSFWKRIILDSNLQGLLNTSDHSVVIDKDDISEKFQRPVIGKPLSFECVIENMVKDGELVTIEDFNKQFAPESGWLGWIYDTIISNTWQWKWRALNEHTIRPQQTYVVLPTVQSIAKAILFHHFQQAETLRPIDHLLTLAQFKNRYAQHFVNEIELTDADVQLVMRYMHSKHGISVADNVKGYGSKYTVIKFPQRENEVATITQHDEAVISIRTTCNALYIQIDELQRTSEKLAKQSVQEKQQGHTQKALYCLKRRNNLQQILDRRLRSMETMDTILLKIESSQDDLQVVQAFNMGADTLRDLLGADGLSIESIDDAMQKIQNALEDQKEVENAMQLGTEDITGYTDADIEDELTQLIQEEEAFDKKPAVIRKEPSVNIPTERPAITSVNSELSRLNQMFSATRDDIPSNSLDEENSVKRESKKVKELA